MKKTILFVVATAALAACATGCCTNSTTGTGSSGGTTGHATTTGGGSTTGGSAGSGSSTGSHSSSGSGGTTGSSSGGSGTGGSSTGGATGGLASVLLVDNDGRPGGSAPDISLTLADGWLTAAGIPHDIYQEPGNGTDQTDIDPQDPQLNGINTIVWVTGDNWGDGDATVSNAQQTSLQAWLDEGGKTLVLFSPGTISSFGANNWTTAEPNVFLNQYAGVANDLYDPGFFEAAQASDLGAPQMPWYPVTGSSTVPAFSNKSWTVQNHHADSGNVTMYLAALQPATGVDVLATVQADPSNSGTANVTVPVAIGNKTAGKKKTSTVVFVGVSIENLANDLPTGNVQCDFLEAVRTYAGLGGAESNCGISVPTGTATSPTLLVDNSFQSTPQTAPVFQGWLTGLGGAYATYTEPTTDYDDVDPNAPALAGLSTIVWGSGSNWGDGTPVISPPQQSLLAQWLDEGGKTLVLFTPALPSDFGRNDWSSPETNPFLTGYVGLQNDLENFQVVVNGADLSADDNNHTSELVTGAAGAFSGLQWTVVNNTQISGNQVRFVTSIVNPQAGLDVLATVPADPAGTGTNAQLPVVVGNKHVGAKGTSTVVYVGFTIENVANTIPGMNVQSDFFSAIASYAAVP